MRLLGATHCGHYSTGEYTNVKQPNEEQRVQDCPYTPEEKRCLQGPTLAVARRVTNRCKVVVGLGCSSREEAGDDGLKAAAKTHPAGETYEQHRRRDDQPSPSRDGLPLIETRHDEQPVHKLVRNNGTPKQRQRNTDGRAIDHCAARGHGA